MLSALILCHRQETGRRFFTRQGKEALRGLAYDPVQRANLASLLLRLGLSGPARTQMTSAALEQGPPSDVTLRFTVHANVTRALDGAGQPEALGKWTLLVDDSHSAALDWKDPEPLDFLYLDGDHRYGPVRRDFEDWQGFVRPGGVILLHDSRRLPDTPENVFNRGWPGPTRLARELAQDNRVELVEEVFSLSIFRKR